VRMATMGGRATVVSAEGRFDVETASRGRFPPDPSGVYERWEEFRDWAAETGPPDDAPLDAEAAGVDPAHLGAPSPAPRQVFAIGRNYRDHAAEGGFSPPDSLVVFTKFPSCVVGPHTPLVLPSDRVDWEIELVVVLGRRAEHVTAEDAWSYVAGLTVGQDYSERTLQFAGPHPQFSLGKSFAGFGPTGPWLVTPDVFRDPDDLELECTINGERVQKARTSSLIFPVPELIARLSAVCPLLPGDLIFTGTPAGVGVARTPQRFLVPGDEVVSRIEGIGNLHQRCASAGTATHPTRREE